MKNCFLITFLSFLFLISTGYSQGIPFNQAEVIALLQEKGITQQELDAKLKEKGIDLNRLNPANPADVQIARREIEIAIAELEAEKNSSSLQDTTTEAGNSVIQKEELDEVIKAEPIEVEREDIGTLLEVGEREQIIQEGQSNIQEAVEEGATLEEAISEEISEELQEELPKAKTWGQQVFRDKKISVYQQSRDVKPPDSYVLGPGDRIGVSIWGYSQENVIFEINDEGYIKPEAMPRITLKGIPYGKAKQLLLSRFSNYYRFRPEEFEVTLNFSRTITVNIVGEVYNYGSFTLPARNTAFNALVATGGPTDIGSVRKIQLIRALEKPQIVDIYEFLLNPSAEEKLFLQENDYIYVPPAEKVVRIGGAVRRPFQYELIEGEGLKELVKYAGGLKLNTYPDLVEIVRTVNGARELLNYNLADILAGNTDDVQLMNGDKVHVKSISKEEENVVSIEGPVTIGGRFQLEENMRLSDLIKKAGIEKEARLDIALLERINIDLTTELEKVNLDSVLKFPGTQNDLLLQSKDKITLYVKSQLVDLKGAKITVTGAVRAPRSFPYDFKDKFTVEKIIALTGGLKQDALDTAYIHRTNPFLPKVKEFVKINIREAINDPTSEDNVTFQPNDELVIFSELPRYESYKVKISGAVRKEGNYTYEPGLRLSDLIYFSNGLERTATDIGYIQRSNPNIPGHKEYIRVNVKEALNSPESIFNTFIEPEDQIVIYSKESYVDKFNVSIRGEVRKGGTFELGRSLRLFDLLSMAGGLTLQASPYAYIETIDPANPDFKTYQSINIQEVASDSSSIQNVYLNPNDKIVVYPKSRYTDNFNFEIEGEVREPGTFQAGTGLTIKDALILAGGLTYHASRFRVELYRLNLDERLGTSTTLIPFEVDEKYNLVGQSNDFTLMPYDKLIVRSIPDFEDMNTVQLEGEVQFPGSYPLIKKNERILDLIKKGGRHNAGIFPTGG